MSDRWTIKELKEVEMETFIISILSERQSGLSPWAPLFEKLAKAKNFMNEIKKKRGENK